MKCPRCTEITLLMTEKSGVEIDYCPECRGVWLDRGELDKILERAGNGHGRNNDMSDRNHDDHNHKHESEHGHDYKEHGNHNKHHKRSLWKELFDF